MGKSPEYVRSSEKILWEGSPETGLVLRNGLLMTFASPLILVFMSFMPLFGEIVTVLSGVFLMVLIVAATVGGLYYYIESTDYIMTESNIYVFSILGDMRVETSTLKSVDVDKNSSLINIDRNNADLTFDAEEKVKFRNISNPEMVENIIFNQFHLEEPDFK